MKIKLDDEIANQCGIDAKEALELLAVAIYKAKGIHGTMAGQILGISEPEFHSVMAKQGVTVNYDVADFLDDIAIPII